MSFDPFWDLSVPIPTANCELDRCLELFSKKDVLDAEEMPYFDVSIATVNVALDF